MARGMVSTLRHMLSPAYTEAYPWGPKELPERSRMWFELPVDENGVPHCKACGLCAKNCADDAIALESVKKEDGPGRRLTYFSIDVGLCMYCGLCVENCPSDGLRHTGEFETATHRRGDSILVLFLGAPDATESVPAQPSPLVTERADQSPTAEVQDGVAS